MPSPFRLAELVPCDYRTEVLASLLAIIQGLPLPPRDLPLILTCDSLHLRHCNTASNLLTVNLSDFTFCIISSGSLRRKFSAFRDSCDQVGPNSKIQNNLTILRSITLITSAKSLFPCYVPYLTGSRDLVVDIFGQTLSYLNIPESKLLKIFDL